MGREQFNAPVEKHEREADAALDLLKAAAAGSSRRVPVAQEVPAVVT